MRLIKLIAITACISVTTVLNSQENNEPVNLSADVLNKQGDKIVFGGYGQVDFSKPLISGRETNSAIDVSRLILSLGYSFSEKTSFFSEIEFEHVKELFVEQAFINHSFSEYFSLRAGLMLVPMGIINEYHEPVTFNGVNRPSVDNIIIPTTWREAGFGFTGKFRDAGLKYQVYLFNGFLGYDGTKGLIGGEKFLRDARQKGAKAIAKSPDVSVKLDFFKVRGLKLGLSGYFGKTESALYKTLDKADPQAVLTADSSVLGLSMFAVDARYNTGKFGFRGEYVFSSLSNTGRYNAFTGKDAGSGITGFYLEAGYSLPLGKSSGFALTPFVRYENYNTHSAVEQGTAQQDKYMVNEVVFGLGWKLAEGAVLKADMQLAKNGAETAWRKTVNAGLGVWF